MKNFKRIIIYPKDVQQVTGKSYRHCLRLIKQAKIQLGKSKQDMLSVKEFCSVYKIDPEEMNF